MCVGDKRIKNRSMYVLLSSLLGHSYIFKFHPHEWKENLWYSHTTDKETGTQGYETHGQKCTALVLFYHGPFFFFSLKATFSTQLLTLLSLKQKCDLDQSDDSVHCKGDSKDRGWTRRKVCPAELSLRALIQTELSQELILSKEMASPLLYALEGNQLGQSLSRSVSVMFYMVLGHLRWALQRKDELDLLKPSGSHAWSQGG